MFIEITPTTPLPTFELYLDGNGVATETADGNDNGVNNATQLDYLDGNYVPNFFDPSAYTTASQEIGGILDNSMPTELSYNFPRDHAQLCAYYIDGVMQSDEIVLDGNLTRVTNTIYTTYNGDGNDKKLDGNAPREAVTGMYIKGLDIDTIQTGDTVEGKFAFRFADFIRLQALGDTTDYHFHFGPYPLHNEYKSLAGNIAFSPDNFDYTIDTGQMVKKKGRVNPYIAKLYTDTTYSVVDVVELHPVRGSYGAKITPTLYEDEFGTTTVGPGERMLITAASYSDKTDNVYDANGNIIGDIRDYPTIAYDPDYTGTKYYLYSRALVGDIPEITSTDYMTVPGHEEYKLKGAVMYQGDFYWIVLKYIAKDYYKILSLTLVTEDITYVKNRIIFASEVFNKELTT